MARDAWTEVIDAVVAVAAAPPKKPGQYVYAAKVPWSMIDRLRTALDAVEIEWRDR